MKVICDVCGTTFPETATHCPICGCAKSPTAQTIPGDDTQAVQESTVANTYAKGGRFSEKNVQRNNRNKYSPSRNSRDRGRQSEKQNGSNKALIAIVIILLLAIVSVVVYIAVNLILNNPNNPANNTDNGQSNVGDQNGDDTERIPCTSIKFVVPLHEFNLESDQALLSVEKTPADTTDKAIYTSSDPAVATVDANGLVRPGTKQGEAVITVTCGDAKAECKVISNVGDAPVVVPPDPPAVTLPDGFVLKLKTYQNSGEITLMGEGEVATLYTQTMGVAPSDITWTTSNPAVATVENGKVTGVNRGTCTITATIGNQTATCKVTCKFDAAPPSDYKISHTSVTIAKGETFNLSLKHKETGANVQGIEWQVSKEGVVSVNGNKITGGTVSTLTSVDVFVEYEGVTYTCKIFVKAPTA